jgi:hypothetical protein
MRRVFKDDTVFVGQSYHASSDYLYSSALYMASRTIF